MSLKRILLIEDEPSIADNIRYALTTDGFEVEWCSTAEAARASLEEKPPVLILLDIGLPDQNGFEFAREVRKNTDIPIIFVTARDAEIDRVAGLELGADDYVVKPFSPRELTARIRTVLRRTNGNNGKAVSAPDGDGIYIYGPFQYDEDRQVITVDTTPLDLSRYELRLLEVLLKRPGKVYSREQLMNRVWDSPEMSLERTVDTHVKNIRRKIKAIRDGEFIITHRGIGYSFKEGE